jgi:hypothetical protein
MTDSKSFNRGLVVGLFAMVGGQAVHWFLTPMNHPDASVLRTVGVAVQATIGFGGALWLAVRQRSTRRAE